VINEYYERSRNNDGLKIHIFMHLGWELSSWFRLNKLVINNDKTMVMSFHAWQNKINLTPKIVFQDMIIKYKNETKF
jgi:hypothetical protein